MSFSTNSGSKQKILVVTESPQIASILSSKFERDGFNVVWKSNASDSFQLIEAQGIDCIILDSVLSDFNPSELVMKLRSIFSSKALPIFVLLDALQEATREEFVRCGADEVISKPFRPTELSKKIRKILRQVP